MPQRKSVVMMDEQHYHRHPFKDDIQLADTINYTRLDVMPSGINHVRINFGNGKTYVLAGISLITAINEMIDVSRRAPSRW